MKTEGKVLDLFISKSCETERPGEDALSVDPRGVVGDKFYDKDENRLILVSSTHSYELAKSEGVEINWGDLGENIVIDLNPYHLQPGDIITIGEAELEVTQHCTLCKGLSKLNPKLPKLLKDDRGIFTKARHQAQINKGDPVTITRSL
jgi:MOSC domain-containing protein YiiM